MKNIILSQFVSKFSLSEKLISKWEIDDDFI